MYKRYAREKLQNQTLFAIHSWYPLCSKPKKE